MSPPTLFRCLPIALCAILFGCTRTAMDAMQTDAGPTSTLVSLDGTPCVSFTHPELGEAGRPRVTSSDASDGRQRVSLSWAFDALGDRMWQEFDWNGARIGGVKSPVNITETPNYTGPWYQRKRKAIWNQAWFSSLRCASGLARWAHRTGDAELLRKAELTRELVLATPVDDGLFPAVIQVDNDMVEIDGKEYARPRPWSEAYWINSDRYPRGHGIDLEVFGRGKVAIADAHRPGWPEREPYPCLVAGEHDRLNRRTAVHQRFRSAPVHRLGRRIGRVAARSQRGLVLRRRAVAADRGLPAYPLPFRTLPAAGLRRRHRRGGRQRTRVAGATLPGGGLRWDNGFALVRHTAVDERLPNGAMSDDSSGYLDVHPQVRGIALTPGGGVIIQEDDCTISAATERL